MIELAAILFSVTAFIAMALTLVTMQIAHAIGFVDCPDGRRKLHGQATALGGGVAVYLSTVGVLCGLCWLNTPWRDDLLSNPNNLLGLGTAAAVIVLIGGGDDAVGFRGRQKLLGQLLAVSLLISFGLCIRRIEIFGWPVELGLLAMPFTLFWLLGAINSINLLDGLDGFAGTVGVVLAGSTALMAALIGHAQTALIAFVFTASLVGFLYFNLPPARIFLGDAGSMLVGLVIGTLAIHSSLKGPGTVLLAAPLAIWAIPIFDSGTAILRRKLTGRSIYATDRGHLPHRLMQQFGDGKAVLVVGGCCMATSGIGLLSVYRGNDLIALISCAAIVCLLVVTRLFGHSELRLFAARMSQLARSLFRLPKGHDGPQAWQEAVNVQGAAHWGELWTALADCAQHLPLRRIQLDVSMPVLEDGYHASWTRPSAGADEERDWSLDVPFLQNDYAIANLKVVGEQNGVSACRAIRHLVELLDEFESRQMGHDDATQRSPGLGPSAPTAHSHQDARSGRSRPAEDSALSPAGLEPVR